MRKLLVLVPFVLVACTQLTTEQQIAVACKGYASTLSAITPFKGQMSASQIASVDQANEVVIPACENALDGTGEPGTDVLRTINGHLRAMLEIEKEVT